LTESVHLEPIVFLARFYSNGRSFKNKDKYDAVLTIQLEGSKKAYISGLHGHLSRKQYRLLVEDLKDLGVETLVFSRTNDREKVYSIEKLLRIL